MVGSAVQQTRRVGEEQAVRTVENRGGGTWMGGGSAHSEAASAMAAWEWTLWQRTTEGRSLEIPREASGPPREGRSEAELDTSEKATSSTGGSEHSLERAGIHPAGGPWRGAREDRDNLRTGSSEARTLQTPVGLVSQGVASALQSERGSVEMTHGGNTRRSP